MDIALLFTGHMINEPNRADPRFPPSLEMVKPASRRPLPLLDRGNRSGGCQLCARRRHSVSRAVSATRNRISLILPFAPETFIKTSVKGPSEGDWEQRFWRLWNATRPSDREVLDLPVSDEAYATCNERLLERAR
jgi:hypothetical protein